MSLLLHVAVLWFLVGIESLEYGPLISTHGTKGVPLVLTARLVAEDSPAPEIAPALNETPATAEFSEETDLKSETVNASSQNSQISSPQYYFASGQLTRLPSPLTDVDLNEESIDAIAVKGVVELTIWVEVDGTVANVSSFVENENARQFANRIADRFLRTRFSPGEIDGKTVRSELKITVVSEPIASPASNS